MDRLQEKTTAPYPPVGADGGQSLSQKPNQSIAEGVTEHKPPERDLEEILRQISRVNDPAYLPTVSMNDLYEQVYPGRPPVVDGLLYAGTYLFVGAPKVGKSFLMAQLAYHVSMGLSLWGYEVRQGTVLYLALEDNHRRLQERLYRMFGVESTGNLFFAIGAKQLGGGLEEQLKGFVREHTDTRLIIIDTLQKIREAGAEKYSYANDYLAGYTELEDERNRVQEEAYQYRKKLNEQMVKDAQEAREQELEDLKEFTDTVISLAEQEANAKIEAIDAELAAREKLEESQKKELQLQQAKAKLAFTRDEDSRESLQREIDRLQSEIDKQNAQAQADAQKAAIRQQIDALKASTAATIAGYQNQLLPESVNPYVSQLAPNITVNASGLSVAQAQQLIDRALQKLLYGM